MGAISTTKQMNKRCAVHSTASASTPNTRLGRLTLRQLEWLAIAGPISFLALVYVMVRGPVHPLFHGWVGFSLIGAALSITVWAFARSIFGAVRRLQTEVEKLGAETSSYNQRLMSLHAANLALMRETGVQEAFRSIVAMGTELLGACHSLLLLAGDGDAERIVTDGATGDADSGCELSRRLGVSNGSRPSAIRPGPRLLLIPVGYLGTPIGTLHLARPDDGPPFSLTDEEIARMFSTHAAIVVQNNRLYAEVRTLAVEAERQSLAHEMHDSLAQVLAFVNTKAQAVEQYLRQNDNAQARQQMAELSAAARGVLTDIRQGIAALRVDIAGKSLRELVTGYSDEFAESVLLKVDLNWQARTEDLELPPEAEVQILRVIQEALANVRRHASASQVNIRAATDQDGFILEIRDDGRGFDAAARNDDGRPHFGLQTMRERAAAIGGELSIESTLGTGTSVTMRLPNQSQR